MTPTAQLIHGDCIDVLPTLVAKNAQCQMAFCDLPYGVLKWISWDAEPFPLSLLWPLLRSTLIKSGVSVFTANMLFAAKLVASNPRCFKYDLVFQKKYPSNFLLAKQRPIHYHENVLVFYEGCPTYNPQMLDERIDVGKTRNVAGQQCMYGVTTTISSRSGKLYPRSVIAHCDDRSRHHHYHPSQKPIALLRYLIRTYSNPGDTILDPTCGSATTIVAALLEGRHSIGIEKDATIFANAQERVLAVQRSLRRK